METRLHRWSAWAGGPGSLLAILLFQGTVVAVMAFAPTAALALVIGLAVVLVVVERPILGVGLLVATRLLSTGATDFVRIGKTSIGLYEPVLLLCALCLVAQAVLHSGELSRAWAWRRPLVALVAWTAVSLLWSQDVRGGLSDLLPLGVVLLSTAIVLAFVRSWRDFRFLLWVWLGTSVAVASLALATDPLPFGQAFEAAARGGRETGLGQQPNWFAMNLLFIIHTAFGMALVERNRLVRMGLVGAGFFVLYVVLTSGSRGAAYATLVGAVVPALAHPTFRRWFFRFAVGTVAVFTIGLAFDIGGSARAFTRILSSLSLQQAYRQQNWRASIEMVSDTWGRGIGAGGYEALLPSYNARLSQTVYDYPHGIFWDVLVHQGILGVALTSWLVVAICRMSRDLVRQARGSEAEVFAWTMPAAMLGYFLWSFLEFTLVEKPFWEWLALYTALAVIVGRGQAVEPIPAWRLAERSPEA